MTTPDKFKPGDRIVVRHEWCKTHRDGSWIDTVTKHHDGRAGRYIEYRTNSRDMKYPHIVSIDNGPARLAVHSLDPEEVRIRIHRPTGEENVLAAPVPAENAKSFVDAMVNSRLSERQIAEFVGIGHEHWEGCYHRDTNRRPNVVGEGDVRRSAAQNAGQPFKPFKCGMCGARGTASPVADTNRWRITGTVCRHVIYHLTGDLNLMMERQ